MKLLNRLNPCTSTGERRTGACQQKYFPSNHILFLKVDLKRLRESGSTLISPKTPTHIIFSIIMKGRQCKAERVRITPY